MADTLKALSAATNGGTAEKAAKRSAINNLTEKGKELFVLVYAKSFADIDPKMNADAGPDDDSGQKPIKNRSPTRRVDVEFEGTWLAPMNSFYGANKRMDQLSSPWWMHTVHAQSKRSNERYFPLPKIPHSSGHGCRQYLNGSSGPPRKTRNLPSRFCLRSRDSVRHVHHTRRQNDGQRRNYIRRI